MWAFNLPCILMVNGGKAYWKSTVKPIYQELYKDILLNVRKSLAASLIEVAKLIDLKDDAPGSEDHLFMVEVANHLLSDVDEVRIKLLPHLCEFVSLFPEDNQQMLLQTLIKERLDNEKENKKTRSMVVEMLTKLFEMFPPSDLVDSEFHQYLYTAIKLD